VWSFAHLPLGPSDRKEPKTITSYRFFVSCILVLSKNFKQFLCRAEIKIWANLINSITNILAFIKHHHCCLKHPFLNVMSLYVLSKNNCRLGSNIREFLRLNFLGDYVISGWGLWDIWMTSSWPEKNFNGQCLNTLTAGPRYIRVCCLTPRHRSQNYVCADSQRIIWFFR